MTKIKFHKVIIENGELFAYFYIDNLTNREFLERKSLEDIKQMVISSETIKAYNAVKAFNQNLIKSFL